MGLTDKLKYLRDLSKNVFFDEFKTIDAIANKNEFKDTGAAGEQYTYRALWYYFQERLFRNVYIRKKDGKLTEIDMVGVGSKGIYVFESKNYSGHIYGDGNQLKWLVYAGKKKNMVYSPVRQNIGHIEALKYHLSNIVPAEHYFSIIIFSARCKVDVKNIPSNTIVTKRDQSYNSKLDKDLRQVTDGKSEVLSDTDIKKICEFFKKAQRPPEEIRKEHLDTVKK